MNKGKAIALTWLANMALRAPSTKLAVGIEIIEVAAKDAPTWPAKVRAAVSVVNCKAAGTAAWQSAFSRCDASAVDERVTPRRVKRRLSSSLRGPIVP